MNQRYAYVDLIRGLAAVTVLLGHYRWFYARSPEQWLTNDQAPLPFYHVLWPAYENATIAVQMFWILSGFVFWVAYGNRVIYARDFWVQRVARLYPLHLITLLLVATMQVLSLTLHGEWQVYENNDAPHFVAHLFLASNWFTTKDSFNGPIWSVSVEILVYLTFLTYLRLKGGLRTAACVILVAFLIERLTHNPISLCACLFFAGVAIGIMAPRVHQRLGRGTLPLTVITGSVLAVAAFVALRVGAASAPTLAIFIGTPVILIFFVACDLVLPPLSKNLHWIGAITYSIYLIHMPILIAIKIACGDNHLFYSLLAEPLIFISYISAVVFISFLTHKYVELPAQKWVKEIAKGHGSARGDPDNSRALDPVH